MRMSRTWLGAAVLSVAVSSVLAAQAPRAGTSALRAQPTAAQGGESGGRQITILGGIATGDGYIDLGFVAAMSIEVELQNAPVNLRIDPYIAIHGGDCGPYDCSVNVFGVGGSAAYDFEGSGDASAPSWFVFGGLGMYHTKFDFDEGFLGFGASSTDLGFQFGGGARFGEKYTAEVRMLSLEGFDPIVLLFGWRL